MVLGSSTVALRSGIERDDGDTAPFGSGVVRILFGNLFNSGVVFAFGMGGRISLIFADEILGSQDVFRSIDCDRLE